MLLQILLLRLLAWVGLPLLLVLLVAGPARVAGWGRAAWAWLFDRRLDPARVFDRVVGRHRDHVALLTGALQQGEKSLGDLERNARQSESAIARLEKEAADAAGRDDVEARAALYKINLERRALESFREQGRQLRGRLVEARKRLYLLELQLRQYEVGRGLLLAQLAEAKTVEQQYALANQFDPYNAVAEWRKAEGLVHGAGEAAASAERVLADTASLPLAGPAPAVDPAALDAQLGELIEALKAKA